MPGILSDLPAAAPLVARLAGVREGVAEQVLYHMGVAFARSGDQGSIAMRRVLGDPSLAGGVYHLAVWHLQPFGTLLPIFNKLCNAHSQLVFRATKAPVACFLHQLFHRLWTRTDFQEIRNLVKCLFKNVDCHNGFFILATPDWIPR
jgi:hypothetical protein